MSVMSEQAASNTDVETRYAPPEDLKTRLKASYDAIAPQYNEWTTRNPARRVQYLDKLLPHLDHEKCSVLELGCGCGIPGTQKLLSKPNISVTANDLSTTQINVARGNLENEASGRVFFIEGDMQALKFQDQSFDAVVALYSIIHLPREEQVEILVKIARWLKPGGYLLANFGAEDLPGAEMDHWLKEQKGWMFWSGWGSKGTIEKVKDVGLQIIIEDVREDVVDATFLWVLARKGRI